MHPFLLSGSCWVLDKVRNFGTSAQMHPPMQHLWRQDFVEWQPPGVCPGGEPSRSDGVGTCTAFPLRVSFSSWLEWVEKSFQWLSLIHLQNCILYLSRGKREIYTHISDQSDLLVAFLSDGAAFPIWVLPASQLVSLEAQGSVFELAQRSPSLKVPVSFDLPSPGLANSPAIRVGVRSPSKLWTWLICWKGGCWAPAIALPFLPHYPTSLVWLPCVFGWAMKQNRTRRCSGWRFFVCLKKIIEKHKCFLSWAHTHVVVFFPLKTYLHLYSRKIPLGFILMPYPALPYLKVQIYLSLYQVTFFP